jgi:hypothetical protein
MAVMDTVTTAGMVMAMVVTATVTAVMVTAIKAMGTMDTTMGTMDTTMGTMDTTMGIMDIGIMVIGTRAAAAGGTVVGMAMALGPVGVGLQPDTFGFATNA